MPHPLEAPTFPWTGDASITPQQAVRSSCLQLAQQAQDVTIDRSALRAYVLSIPSSAVIPPPPRAFPLSFTLQSSINFHCTLALLQFGSGFRSPLHAAAGRGASDTVTYGLLGMHISAPAISADLLASLSLSDIASLFQLKIEEEYEIRPAITSMRRTDLWQLADSIRRVCNEAGAVLRALQCHDFTAFILRSYMRPAPQEPETAASLLRRLLTHFPSLNDRYVLSPSLTVCLYKRAQLLVAELALHHSPESPFPPPPSLSSALLGYDVASLSALADNVVPCVLQAVGVLRYSERLTGMIERGEEVDSERLQAEIRGCAVVAVDEMVQLYNEQRGGSEGEAADGRRRICAAELSTWLWSVAGKEPEMRRRSRHVSKNTLFY